MIKVNSELLKTIEQNNTLRFYINSFAVLYYNVVMGLSVNVQSSVIILYVSGIPYRCFTKTLQLASKNLDVNGTIKIGSCKLTVSYTNKVPDDCLDVSNFINYYTPKRLDMFCNEQSAVVKRCVEIISHFYPSSRIFTPKRQITNCTLLYVYGCAGVEEFLSDLILQTDYKLCIECISDINDNVLEWYNLSV